MNVDCWFVLHHWYSETCVARPDILVFWQPWTQNDTFSFPSKMEHVVYCHSFPSGTVFLCERGSRKTLFRQILDLIMHLRIRSNAKVISVLCLSSAVYNAINCNRRLQTPILNTPSLTLSHTIWHPCQAATSEIFLTHFANVNLMRASEGITLMQLENILIAHSSEPSACIQARFWLEF